MPPPRPGIPGRAVLGLSLISITDGSSNTALVAEALEPVIWTKPDELAFTPNGPLPKLGGVFAGGANIVRCDGSAFFLPSSTPPAVLKALITATGGEMVELP